jgi:hypothetical protein
MTEFYWQYINLPENDVNEIKNLYLESLPTNDYFFQPLNISIKNFLGLEVQRFVLIQVAARATGRIHTDWRPTTHGHQLALQIPLTNCEDSTTSIWASDYEPPTQYTPNGQPYNYYDPSRCKKITEFKLTRPVLWRTDLPHSVDNPTDDVRRAISIRFKEDPWHLI